MRKIVTASVFLALVLIVPLQSVNVATANFSLPDISITYPNARQIQKNTTFPLEILVRVWSKNPLEQPTAITFSLDGNPNITLTNPKVTTWSSGEGFTLSARSTLANLAEGNHTLKAYSIYRFGTQKTTSINFTINPNYEFPMLVILSPQVKTYTVGEMPLVFFVNGNVSYAYYVLDGGIPFDPDKIPVGSINFPGNTTITGLSDGSHEIYVSVYTENGQAGKVMGFSVNTSIIYKNQKLFITSGIIAALITTLSVILYKRRGVRPTSINK